MAKTKQKIINEQRDEITRLKTELKTKDEDIAALKKKIETVGYILLLWWRDAWYLENGSGMRHPLDMD